MGNLEKLSVLSVVLHILFLYGDIETNPGFITQFSRKNYLLMYADISQLMTILTKIQALSLNLDLMLTTKLLVTNH